MSVLESQQRIGDDDTESVEPNSIVTVVFFGKNIHGKAVALAAATPIISIEWIGRSLWWGGTSFNASAPLFFDMVHFSGSEWRYQFTMIGHIQFGGAVPGVQALCVEASISHGQFTHVKRRYCIPRRPSDGGGLARRRLPRRRLIPTPDTTGLAKQSLKR